MADFPFMVPLSENFAMETPSNNPKAALLSGSRSDWEPCMRHCARQLDDLGIWYEGGVTSMHRTHNRALQYAELAYLRGIRVIIACAGGSAHLPGMMAAATTLPVIAVAPKRFVEDVAAVHSTIAMPPGVPAVLAGCGRSGAINAALYAARILALHDEDIDDRLTTFIREQTAGVPHTYFD